MPAFLQFLSSKEGLGAIAGILSVVGYTPYIRDIIRQKTRPHLFSWIIWTLLAGIVFFAQIAKGAGPGAWTTGTATVMCVAIILLTLKHGDKTRTKSDWVFFFLGLAAIPLWRLTDSPALAVVLVTAIDYVAFVPTFRKSWHKPHEETLFAYFISAVKNGISLFALQSFSLATALFPFAVGLINLVFVAMVFSRRSNPKIAAQQSYTP
ncbi:MAG: hypothetical protein P4M13_03200 [Alphaproteobacteria bacterium]|nr:hypothetical protein [Alphaproteobacteria bacterium]